MAAKSNSKSVRLTNEVLEYIENYEGDGFNQKFENIILFAMRTEKDRKSRIKQLDKEILAQSQRLSALIEKYRKLDSGLYQALNLERSLKTLRDTIEQQTQSP